MGVSAEAESSVAMRDKSAEGNEVVEPVKG